MILLTRKISGKASKKVLKVWRERQEIQKP
jgi:hypothetical protein